MTRSIYSTVTRLCLLYTSYAFLFPYNPILKVTFHFFSFLCKPCTFYVLRYLNLRFKVLVTFKPYDELTTHQNYKNKS